MVNYFVIYYICFNIYCENYFVTFNSLAAPLTTKDTYIVDIEYSPLVGGFGIILNDGRAALLTASSLKFDPNVRY